MRVKGPARLSHSDRRILASNRSRDSNIGRDNFVRKIERIESTFRDYGIAPPWIKAYPFDRVQDRYVPSPRYELLKSMILYNVTFLKLTFH